MEEAARFVLVPLLDASKSNPDNEGAKSPSSDLRSYFTIQVLQPGRDPLVMQLTGDQYTTMTVASGIKRGTADHMVTTLAMEILRPCGQHYEITFYRSQLGLRVDQNSPMRIVGLSPPEELGEVSEGR